MPISTSNDEVLRRPPEFAQYLSIVYTERLAANDIVALVGSKGDSYLNGLYKWELIYRHGPGRGLDDVEFVTLTYVDGFNQRRLHGEIAEHGYVTPADFEAAYYRQSVEAATQQPEPL